MATTDILLTKPQKPWKLDNKQIAINGLAMIFVLALTPVILKITPLSGKLGATAIFVLLGTATNVAISIARQGIKTLSNAISSSVIYLATALVLLPLSSVLFTVFMKGKDSIRLNTFTQDMRFSAPDAPYTEGGALHAILGTGEIVLIASLISIPLGVLTALYLTEIKGRFESLVRFLVQAMSGVPSIVAGLFIYSALVVTLGIKYSGIVGSFALSILMLPTVARTAEEVLKLIPNDLREAGVALGATQWRTVVMVVVPAARSGILTAVILGVARVAGETAPLLLTILGNTTINLNPVKDPMAALPLYTFNLMKTGLDVAITRAWGGALILLILVLILFISARLLSGKKR